MSIDLKEADHRKLDRTIDAILRYHKNGEITLQQAREAIAHLFTAAAIDNKVEVDSWLTPERIDHWKSECDLTRT